MPSRDILEQTAIDAAINAKWQNAVDLNTELLTFEPVDIETFLRLGYAYLQINNLKDARKYYKEALKIQPKHNIALENLERIEVLDSKKKNKNSPQEKYDPSLFLEHPGRTKSVALVNLGQKEDLAGLSIGEEVILKEKKRRLEVRTFHGDYIGTLPDDISKRLLYFIKEGSVYNTHIKEIDLTEIVVFIREEKKGKKVLQYPSFPSNSHGMLTDINQLEEDEIAKSKGSEDDEDESDEDLDLDHERWDEEEPEEDDEKESLDDYVEVEEAEEEEE